MIAVDTNILVYAHDPEFRQHPAARARLQALAEGRARWALPIFCLGEFVRVMTHRKLFAQPLTSEEAAAAVRRLSASPSVTVLLPGADFLDHFLDTIEEARATDNLVFDAMIAALCAEHGVARLLTEDRDFARFAHVEVEHL